MSEPLKVIAGAEDNPLVIGDVKMGCYVLEDETRVLSQRGVLIALGRSKSIPGSRSDGDKLPPFLSQNNLKPFINKDLLMATKPIRFKAPSAGKTVNGYNAEMLPMVCEVYMAARDANALHAHQKHIANKNLCKIIPYPQGCKS